MSEVLEKVRAKYPQYADIPDDELTVRLGTKYPAYLERDASFRQDFQRTVGQRGVQAALAGTATSSATSHDEEADLAAPPASMAPPTPAPPATKSPDLSGIQVSPYDRAKADRTNGPMGTFGPTNPGEILSVPEVLQIPGALLSPVIQGLGLDVAAADFMQRTGLDPSSTPEHVINLPRIDLTAQEEALARGSKNPFIKALPTTAGLWNLAARNLEGFAQPESALLLPLLGGEGAVAKTAATALGTEQLVGLPDEVRESLRVLADPQSTHGQKVLAVGQPLVGSVLAGTMLKHGLKATDPVYTEAQRIAASGAPATAEALKAQMEAQRTGREIKSRITLPSPTPQGPAQATGGQLATTPPAELFPAASAAEPPAAAPTASPLTEGAVNAATEAQSPDRGAVGERGQAPSPENQAAVSPPVETPVTPSAPVASEAPGAVPMGTPVGEPPPPSGAAGTTPVAPSTAPAQDFARYNELVTQFKALSPQEKFGAAGQALQRDIEAVKNRHGGKPPPQPVAAAPAEPVPIAPSAPKADAAAEAPAVTAERVKALYAKVEPGRDFNAMSQKVADLWNAKDADALREWTMHGRGFNDSTKAVVFGLMGKAVPKNVEGIGRAIDEHFGVSTEDRAAKTKSIDDARTAEKEAQAKATAESEAAKRLAKVGPEVVEFTKSMAPLESGRTEKVLMTQVAKRAGEKLFTGPRKDVVQQLLNEGYEPTASEVDAVKDPSRTSWNRMDGRQQDDFMRRKADAGKKSEYSMQLKDGRGFVVTKAEYDFANFLAKKSKPATAAAQSASPAEPEKVVAAAVKFPNGEIRTGRAHPLIPGYADGGQMGFATNKRPFITREEASRISGPEIAKTKKFQEGIGKFVPEEDHVAVAGGHAGDYEWGPANRERITTQSPTATAGGKTIAQPVGPLLEVPADLQSAIANERTGTGPLSATERVELNELRITRDNRGKLGALNQARLDWLEQRDKELPTNKSHDLSATPPTPTTAANKVQKQVSKVAATQGQRPAKAVKTELVSRIDEEIEKLKKQSGVVAEPQNNLDYPDTYWIGKPGEHSASIRVEKTKSGYSGELYGGPGGKFKVDGKTVEEVLEDAKAAMASSSAPGKVTIDIPGDGSFTVYRHGPSLLDLRDRANAIKTDVGKSKETRGASPPGEVSAQAEKAAQAYGSVEAAYRSAKRQRDALQAQEPPAQAEARQEWNDQIASADALIKELYDKTNASITEARAEQARTSAATYREGADGFQKRITRVEAIKRKTKRHLEELEDLRSRYAENQKRISEYDQSAEKLEQQAAREKMALDADPPKPAPEPAPAPAQAQEPVAPAAPKSYAAKSKALADKLRALKSPSQGGAAGNMQVFGLANHVYDTAIEIAAQVIENGGKAADAIAKAIEHIRSVHRGEFDEAGLRQQLQTALAGGEGSPGTFGVAARITAARAAEGRTAPIAPGEGISGEDSVTRGRQLLAAGADPDFVLKRFADTKALSADDMAVVRAHGEQLAKATNAAADRHGVDSPEAKAAWQAESDWLQKVKPMQTEWSRMGAAQQGETEIDTGTFHGLQRAFFEATGKDFDPAQAKTAQDLAQQAKAADEATAAAKAKLFESLGKEPVINPYIATLAKEIAAKIGTKLHTAADAARERLKAQGVKFGSGPLHELPNIRDYAIIGAEHLWDLSGDAVAWGAKMLETFGDSLKDHLPAILEESRKLISESSDAELKKVKAPSAVKQQAKKAATRKVVTPAAELEKPATARDVLAEHEPGRPFTPEQVKAVWDHAKGEYLDKGETDFDTLIHGVASDLGMAVDDVRRALAQPRGAKRLTDDLYRKMSERRRVETQARAWLKNQQVPGWLRFMRMVPRAFFIDKVFGHGTVGMVTHAGLNVFNPNAWRTYFPNFFRQFGLVFKPEYHERMMQDLTHDPNFLTAKRAGLVNDPWKYADDYQNAAIKTFMGKFSGLVGNRGFDALKLFRQARFNQAWNGLPANLKTPAYAGLLADGINHSTGVVKMPFREWSAWAFFAPKLEASRWAWMFADPAKAGRIFSQWETATPEQRAFALSQLKEKAAIAGTYFSLLAANQGLLSATGDKQKINFTDPRKGDFLSFKAAGHNLGIVGPMLGMVRLFANLAHDSMGGRSNIEKLTPRGQKFGETLGSYARGKLSPFAGFAYNIAAQSDFQGRPLPFSNDPVPSYLRKRGQEAYSWSEYLSETFSPIPAQEAIREVLAHQGMSESQIKAYMEGLVTAVVVGGTGAKLSYDYSADQ